LQVFDDRLQGIHVSDISICNLTFDIQVDDHLACAVAGITADANILINYGVWIASRIFEEYIVF
jgi:hypothetical protein